MRSRCGVCGSFQTFDVLLCPKCAGPMTVLAYLTEGAVVEKTLGHLGLPTSSPPTCPARRGPEQAELFEGCDEPLSTRPAPKIRGQAVAAGIRGPPSAEPCPANAKQTAANGDPSDEGTVDLQMDWGA